jgi:predicted DNA binding protein
MKTAELIAAEVAGLRMLLASSSDENPAAVWKRPSGRLTDEGVAAINTALETGLSVTEISRRFGISQSAASQRKQVWLASKGNTS